MDRCIVYYSRKDRTWIAHSLHTDQIGTGDSLLSALTDLLRGVQNLVTLAETNKDIALWREAPKKIKDRAKKARTMPQELYSVAYKRLIGKWPDEIRVFAEPARQQPLTVSIPEGDIICPSRN